MGLQAQPSISLTTADGGAPSRQGDECEPLVTAFGQFSLAFQLDSVPERSVTVSSGFLYAATTK